jgi:hypothetical protein
VCVCVCVCDVRQSACDDDVVHTQASRRQARSSPAQVCILVCAVYDALDAHSCVRCLARVRTGLIMAIAFCGLLFSATPAMNQLSFFLVFAGVRRGAELLCVHMLCESVHMLCESIALIDIVVSTVRHVRGAHAGRAVDHVARRRALVVAGQNAARRRRLQMKEHAQCAHSNGVCACAVTARTNTTHSRRYTCASVYNIVSAFAPSTAPPRSRVLRDAYSVITHTNNSNAPPLTCDARTQLRRQLDQRRHCLLDGE